jgi:hypothetical protein
LQTPFVHVSVVLGHCVQPPPAVPHSAAVPGEVHADPEQQPSGHVSSSQDGHVWPLHVPGEQSSHVAPPEPQLSLSVPGQHVEPLQHPVEHDDASQRHAPPRQYWPLAEQSAGRVPHVHVPLESTHVSPEGWQSTHCDPLTPHSSELGIGTQVVPEQHPEHEVESHTQACAALQY